MITLSRILKGTRYEIMALNVDGKCHTFEFLEVLRRKHPKDYKQLIALLEDASNREYSVDCYKSRPLGKGLFEFKRKRSAPRLFYFYEKESIIICTHGFWKRESNREQKEQIERARQYKNMYTEGKENGKK